MKPITLLFAVSLLASSFCSAASAAPDSAQVPSAATTVEDRSPTEPGNPSSVSTAKGEWSALGGYGISHVGFGATKTQVQTVDAILRYGRFLSGEVGKGSWIQGRHELFMELPFHLAVDPKVRGMVGGYLLGSWKFTTFDTYFPYVLAGGGVLFNDLGHPMQGTRLNFSYQAGCGLQHLFRKDTALGLEYRYHHISNAGTATPNEPLNSSKILLSISLFR